MRSTDSFVGGLVEAEDGAEIDNAALQSLVEG
jgi:hypothetical protein